MLKKDELEDTQVGKLKDFLHHIPESLSVERLASLSGKAIEYECDGGTCKGYLIYKTDYTEIVDVVMEPPGVWFREHAHSGLETIVVPEGQIEFTFTDNGEVVEVIAPGALIIDRSRPHKAQAKETTRVIGILTPPNGGYASG